MKEQTLDKILNYLYSSFEFDENSVLRGAQATVEQQKQIFKSIYYGQSDYLSLPGSGTNYIKSTLEKLPIYSRHNVAFSHYLTSQITCDEAFLLALQNKTNKDKDEPSQPEKSEEQDSQVPKCLSRTMHVFGLTKDIRGETQNEMSQAVLQQIDSLIDDSVSFIEDMGSSDEQHGLQAADKQAQYQIANDIKAMCNKLSGIQRTLKNISAISSVVLFGLEKIKSSEADSGYDFGRDISKADWREIATLNDPATRNLFLFKFAKGELLQESSTEKKGLGDLVIGIDTSDSTNGYGTNGRIIEVELGIAMAMGKLATKHKCKVKYICFSDNVYHTSEWLRNNRDVLAWFVTLQSEMRCSGTDFDCVIKRQVKEVQQSCKYNSGSKPGMILITDGYGIVSDSVQSEVEQTKQKLGAKMYTYFVAKPFPDPRERSFSLVKCSNKAYLLDSTKRIDSQVGCFQDLI